MNAKPTPSRCFAHSHMTLQEYGLWTYAREVSYKSGEFYLSGPKAASAFSDTGKNVIYRVGKRLIAKGWFKLLRPRHRSKITGMMTPNVVSALTSEQWHAEYGTGECPCPEMVMENATVPPAEPTSAEHPCPISSMTTSEPSMTAGVPSMTVYETSMTAGGNKIGSKSGSKSGRERGRDEKTDKHNPNQTPLSSSRSENEHGQVEEALSRIQHFMAKQELKFVRASKDKQTPSTKDTITKHLLAGVDERTICRAITNIPLNNAPNPSFEIRDNLDQFVNSALASKREREETQQEIATATEQEKIRAKQWAEEIRKQQELEEAQIEECI